MGSEHYCLRWNNHQSNLLGVFSQLLQDESLVDVTLACSEGASIRAHKVVLSACSSYFQTLFLDHPARHPIVILKDVRFAELRTLVDFMYKGEVNVEYCQLSALLKTAESLKVKGLAEQSTALAEPKREAPDRLHRPQSHSSAQHAPLTTSAASPSSSSAHPTSGGSTSGGGAGNVSPHQQQLRWALPICLRLGSPAAWIRIGVRRRHGWIHRHLLLYRCTLPLGKVGITRVRCPRRQLQPSQQRQQLRNGLRRNGNWVSSFSRADPSRTVARIRLAVP